VASYISVVRLASIRCGTGRGKHVTTKVLPVLDVGHQMPEVRGSDHKASDTIEALDRPFLIAVIDGLAAALSAL
jgi:hypothetical protein